MGEQLDQLVEHRGSGALSPRMAAMERVDVSGRVSAFHATRVPGLVPELGDERSLRFNVPSRNGWAALISAR